MKKQLALVLALTIILTSAAGCGKQEADTDATTTTTVTETASVTNDEAQPSGEVGTTTAEDEMTVDTTTVALSTDSTTARQDAGNAQTVATSLVSKTTVGEDTGSTTTKGGSTVSAPKQPQMTAEKSTTKTTTTTSKKQTTTTAGKITTTKNVTTKQTTTAKKTTTTTTARVTTKATDAHTLQYRTQVWNLVNQERKKAGLAALEYREDIQGLTDIRAAEIKSLFSHDRPDGREFHTVFDDAKIDYRYVGENLAKNQQTPEAVVEAWMNSPAHRENILDADYTGIAVGYLALGTGECCWVQLFIKS